MKKRKTDLINVLTNDLARVTSGINLFLQLLSSIIFTIIQISLAFWLSPHLTIFVLIAGMLLGFFSRKFIKQSKALGKKYFSISPKLSSGCNRSIKWHKRCKK